jgi:hypothetical protein
MLLSFEVATRPQGAAISTLSPSASAAAIGVLPKGFFVKSQLGRLGSLGKKSPDPPRISSLSPPEEDQSLYPCLSLMMGILRPPLTPRPVGWQFPRPPRGPSRAVTPAPAFVLPPIYNRARGSCSASIALAISVDGRRVANLTRSHTLRSLLLSCGQTPSRARRASARPQVGSRRANRASLYSETAFPAGVDFSQQTIALFG